MKSSRILRVMGLFLALLCVVSCEKKESVLNEDDVGGDDLIVGVWQLTDYTLEGNVATDDGALNVKGEGGEDMADLLIAFHPDGTTSYSGVGFALEYTVFKDDNPIAEDEMRMQSLVLNGTWKKEGDKLIVDYPEYGIDALEIDIESLTENELHLAATVEPVMPLPEIGYTDVTTAADAHFVRTSHPVQEIIQVPGKIEEIIADPIVGTWQLQSLSSNAVLYPLDPEDPIVYVSMMSKDAYESGAEVTFHLNGTTSSNGTFTVVMKVEGGGTVTEREIESQPMVENGGTWQRIGDDLILSHPNYPGGSQEMAISTFERSGRLGEGGETKEMLILQAAVPPPVPVPGMSDIDTYLIFERDIE